FVLQTEEYDMKRHAINDVIDQKLLAREAARRKITSEELAQSEIEGKARPVTEGETRGVYEATKERYGDKPESEVMKLIQGNLHQGRINVQRSVFLKELRSKADIQVRLDPPRISVPAGDSRAKGPKDAPITIVEFAEFQCPYCARMV